MADKEKPQRSIFLTIFGAVFALIGGIVLFATIREYVRTVGTYGWERVPADITSIEIEYPQKAPRAHDSNIFELKTSYEYEVAGRKHQGTSYRLKPFKSSKYQKLADHKQRMIREEVQSAFVDPDDPANAILERGSLSSGLTLLFPIPFVLIGLGLMAAGMGLFGRFESLGKKKSKSFARDAKNSRIGGCGMALFGSVFFVFGLGFLFPLLINPLMRSYSARNWEEVPCTVIWSRVCVHSGDDSDTFSPDVFFEYKYNGEVQRSNQYSFMTGSSSGSKRKRAIVKKFPAGHKATCFVDPVKPWHAVINRSMVQVGFWFLLPTIFLLVGGGIMAAGLAAGRKRSGGKPSHRKRRNFRQATSNALTNDADPTSADSIFVAPAPSKDGSEDPLLFHTGKSRLLAFIGTIFFALFWNGISAVMFGQNILRFIQGAGNVDVFLLIFSIPFLIVGTVLLLAVFYSFGGLFNPSVTMAMKPSQPRTGEEAIVDWELKGGWSRVSRLRIVLEGVEEATYRRGTDTLTDDETFYRRVLAEETDPDAIRSGSVIFELPLGVMPTLTLIDNCIRWRLSVEGQIRLWPDILEIQNLNVFPFATPGSQDGTV